MLMVDREVKSISRIRVQPREEEPQCSHDGNVKQATCQVEAGLREWRHISLSAESLPLADWYSVLAVLRLTLEMGSPFQHVNAEHSFLAPVNPL